MGLFGLWYVPFLKRKRARFAAAHEQLDEPLDEHVPLAEHVPLDEAGSGEPDPAQPSSEYVSRDSGSKTVSSTETPGKSTSS
jgi:hypothetical protein